MKKKEKKLHYGWVICCTCTLLIFITMGTASNGLSVFMPYIMDSFGLTNAQTSFLVTLRCTFAFVSMLVVGRYYKWIGYRLGTGLAAMCCGCAYLVYWLSSGYLQVCVGASLAGISYGLGSMIPVSILINRWFIRHKALAVGICASGSGMAVVFLPPIITDLILKYSLRTAFMFTAAGVFLGALLILLLIRAEPADKDLQPLGFEDINPDLKTENRRADTRSISKRSWVLIMVVCVILGSLANPGFVHLSVLYTSEGFAPMTVALLISICGLLLAVGKVICGETVDLLGGFRGTMLFFAILTAGNAMCCLAFTGSTGLAVIAVILFGVGSPVCTVGIPVWAGDLDRQERYADNVRRMQLIYAAGAMLFASLPGIIADVSGSYIPYYGLFAFLTAAAAACMAVVYKTER